MKAKLILTAMAMPVLFAACTSDELVPMEEMQQQEQRPLLSENFRLTTSVETKGDVQTRYAVSEKDNGSLNFAWTGDDAYAAALIDESSKKDPADWKIIPTSGTINKFTYNETTKAWDFLENTGVGHYLFSYKYDEADVEKRLAVGYSLPTVQKVSEDDLNAAIKEDNRAVAAALLRGESADVQLKNLFAYPKFVIKFDNGEPISAIKKVVLINDDGKKETEDGFIVSGGYNHLDVWNMFDPETIETEKEANNWDEDEYWASKQTSDFVIDEEKTTYKGVEYTMSEYADIVKSHYIVAEFDGDGASLTPEAGTDNEIFEVRFMIPGGLFGENGDYTADNFSMEVHTDNGVYKLKKDTNLQEAIKFKNSTNGTARDRMFARNTSYTLNLKPNQFEKVDDAATIITNQNEWNELVESYGATEKQTVVIVGDEFKFDADAEWPAMLFTIKGNAAVKAGATVAIGKVKADNVFVEEGATLNVTASLTADIVNNGGEVKFKANTNKIGTVTNNAGKVTVAAGFTAGFMLDNKATFVNNGTAKLASGSVNEGTIKNNAQLEVSGLTNIEDAVINIAKEGAVVSVAKNGLVNNKNGKIVNEGELSSRTNSGGTISNAGEIDAVGTTKVTENAGKIIAHTAMAANIVIGSGKGVVAYAPAAGVTLSFSTGSDETKDLVESPVNTLEVSGNLTINKDRLANVETINMNADGDLSMKNAIANLNVLAGTTTLTSDITVSTKLFVKRNAKLVVNAGKTLTIKSALENKGTVNVKGTLTAETQQENDNNNGTINEVGSESKITWNKPETEQEKYEKKCGELEVAYGEAVYAAWKEAWKQDSYSYRHWSYTEEQINKNGGYEGWLAYTSNEAKKAVTAAYNKWQECVLVKKPGYEGDAYKEVEFKDALVEGVLKTQYDKYQKYVNETAIAKVKAAKTANRITVAWKGEAGYAYYDEVEDFTDMWDEYVKWLKDDNNVKTWCYDTNEDDEVIAHEETKVMKFAIEAYIKGLYTNDGTEKWTATKPSDDLIPDYSYLDVQKTGGNYKAIETWMTYSSTTYDGPANKAGLCWYSAGWYDAATLNEYKWDLTSRLRGWYLKWHTEDVEDDLEKYDIQQQANLYYGTVITWKAPQYSSANLGAAIDLIQKKTNRAPETDE